MKRTDNKREVTEAISYASPAEESIIPEESTEVSTHARFKNHMKTRLKELANRYGLSHTYNSRNIKDAIVEKFNQPTQVLCFKFVRNSPWRQDLKIMVEECFEELIRACIINNSVVTVEHASKKRFFHAAGGRKNLWTVCVRLSRKGLF